MVPQDQRREFATRARAVDLLGDLFGSPFGHVDAMTVFEPVLLEHPPQILDDRLVGQGVGVLGFDPACLHAGEHHGERRAEDGVVEFDP